MWSFLRHSLASYSPFPLWCCKVIDTVNGRRDEGRGCCRYSPTWVNRTSFTAGHGAGVQLCSNLLLFMIRCLSFHCKPCFWCSLSFDVSKDVEDGATSPPISSCWAFHSLLWLPWAKRLLLWQIDGLTLGKHLPSRTLLQMSWGVYAEVVVDRLGADGTATQRTVWTSLFGGAGDDCNSPYLVQRGSILVNLPERLWGPVLRDKAVIGPNSSLWLV